MVTADSRVVGDGARGIFGRCLGRAHGGIGQRQANHIARQFERSDVESGRQDCVF